MSIDEEAHRHSLPFMASLLLFIASLVPFMASLVKLLGSKK